ncbi:MAG: hypothetical protein U0S49_07510, partial [Rhodospirillales bacterium]|nr:hypothetical protein [Rhodospirillales bacterium]
RNPSWPAVIEPHQQAGYMTAPDPIAEAAPKPLATRGPSIHDDRLSFLVQLDHKLLYSALRTS